MTVTDLILRLETLPGDADVRLCVIFESKQPTLIGMYFDTQMNSVVLQDHITEIKPRLFTAYDGNVYDVPWAKR